MKKIFFAVGGTGGHLHPAQKLAEDLKNEAHIFFIGNGLSRNMYFDKKFVHFDISSYPLRKNPLEWIPMFSSWMMGLFQSIGIFFRQRPDMVVTFGAFQAAPALLAALLFRIPIVVYEHNTFPGRAARFFSRFSKKNFVVFSDTEKFFNQKVQYCQPLLDVKETKEDPYAYFDLDPDKKTLLIFGGSQGAHSLNEALKKVFGQLSQHKDRWQILHFIGFNSDLMAIERNYRNLGFTHYVEPFCRRMDLALSVCDFAITRSGAQTLLELILYQVPSILIPYPYATDDHQIRNAQFFVQSLEGGMVLLQNEQFESNLKLALDLVLSEKVSDHSKKKLAALFEKWQKRDTVKEHILELLQ